MRYAASEKAEIIKLVEQSPLPIKHTLEKLGIPRATFYRWYDLYQSGGPEALDDRSPRPDRVWNRIPDDIRERIVRLALDEPALWPRELALRFTDTEKYQTTDKSQSPLAAPSESRITSQTRRARDSLNLSCHLSH